MADFKDHWHAFEDEIGPVLVEAVQSTAPRDTGQLADATQSWRDQADVLQVISTDNRGPIARFVIRGTRPHPIEPVHAKFLHWVNAAGEDVFASHVDHPGTSPNPYNYAAWEGVRDRVVQRFGQVVGRGYALALLNPWRDKVIK